MSSNQLKAGAIISYLQMALAIVVGLVYTPTMIRVLGPSEYGLYNTVVSTISMLSVLSLGFNSSYIRYYSKYKTQNDQESIWRLNGLFMIIFTIIGTVVFACGMFLTNHLHLVFDRGLSAAEYVIAKRLMLLLTINLSISFRSTVFNRIWGRFPGMRSPKNVRYELNS
jgi:O-antigen/teichoic acid export membrane protein